ISSSRDLVLIGRDMQAEEARRRILWFGDSLTCGYGVLGETGCNFSPETESVLSSFCGVVSDYYDADFHAVAWSGKGVVRNFCSPTAHSDDPLPIYTWSVLGNLPELAYDPLDYIPDVIVVTIGGNDFSCPPYPTDEDWLTSMVEWVSGILDVYGGVVPLVLGSGPLDTDPADLNMQAADTLRQRGYQVETAINFGLMTHSRPYEYGCDGHPSQKVEDRLSGEYIRAIFKHTGWK
ncbi:hypothetical protein KIPB_012122, partial [Kipferlia bialata]